MLHRGLPRLSRGPPVFLGLSFLSSDDANFSSPRSRRLIRLAHEMHNLQQLPALSLAQRAYVRRHPSRRFHIRRFSRPSQPGFLALYKESLGDYCIRELGASAGVAHTRSDNFYPRDCDTFVALPTVDEPMVQLLKKMEKLFENVLRELLCRSAETIRSIVEFQQNCPSDKDGSRVLACGQSRTLLQQIKNVDSSCFDVLDSDSKIQSFSDALSLWLDGVAMRMICATPTSTANRNDLTWQISLTKLLFDYGRRVRCRVEVVRGTSGNAAAALITHVDLLPVDTRVHLLSQAMNHARHELWCFFGSVMTRRGICAFPFATPVTADVLAQHDGFAGDVRINWPSPSPRKKPTNRNRAVVAPPGVVPYTIALKHRSDVTHTSKQQAMRVMRALNSLLRRVESSNHATSVGAHMHATREALYVSMVSPNNNTNEVSQQCMLVDPSIPRPESGLRRMLPEMMSVGVEVVEFVLEKVGLPHEFVVQDILEELQERKEETVEWLGQGGVQAPRRALASLQRTAVLTHSGILDHRGQSLQRCRIRGPLGTAQALRGLSNRLRPDQFLKHICRASFSDGAALGLKPPHMTIVWKAESVLRRPPEEARLEEEFWSQHYYRIHNPVILWSSTAVHEDRPAPPQEEAAVQKHRNLLPKETRLLHNLRILHRSAAVQFDLRPRSSTQYAYQVTLRRIPAQEVSAAQAAVEAVKRDGFLNYFGPQRFGPYTARGMHPGLHLLKGEYQAAAYILIGAGTMDGQETKGSTTVQTVLRDALSAEQLTGGLSLECLEGGSSDFDVHALLAATSPATNDACREAFHNVLGPSVVRSLIQEFLVFVWNEILSERVVACGPHAVLEGDLVMREEEPVGGGGDARLLLTAALRMDNSANPEGGPKRALGVVRKEEVETGRWGASDVLLPIPGAGVKLPSNPVMQRIYQSILQAYGIPFDVERQSWPIFFSPGAARTNVSEGPIAAPQVVDDDDLLKECFEELVAAEGSTHLTKAETRLIVRGGYRPLIWRPCITSTVLSHEGDPARAIPGGGGRKWDTVKPYWEPQKGTGILHLSFVLPLGVYASMLVREITKLDVNHPDALRPLEEKSKHKVSVMSPSSRGLYENILKKKRKKNIALAPMAIQRASLYQRIFHSGGMRHSLMPSTKGRDSVSK